MSQADLGPGPGNFVKDTLVPVLIGTAVAGSGDPTKEDLTATTTVDYQKVNYLWDAAVAVLETAAADGTSVTVDVELFAADDSSGTNAVSLGAFRTLTEADDTTRLTLQVRILKPYVGAVATVAGTSPSVHTSVVLRDKDFRISDGQEAEGDLS